ncbi:unnamed protein product [Candidula unifasciata]|uniref:C-type lectin domain-containing protein n=1 Tax=Candidula unifasciata TaxID=100452 RepID=A0A8S3Z8Y9_9EUPU|nr:unnamed protein product [Candidula unifasciata]
MISLTSLVFFAYIVSLSLDVLAQCNPGWYHFAQSCYAYGESMVTFAAAEEMCKFYSAHLAEIDSATENNFLKSIARNKSSGAVWIGGTDVFNEGTWLWLSTGHRIFNFLDWAPGQPDDSAGEDCLGLYGVSNYQWNDFICSNLGTFICEIELTTVNKK